MTQDIILFRILQGGSALAFSGLLVLSISLEKVGIWLRLPVLLLCLSCFFTFLSTFYMPDYVFPVVVANMVFLGITGAAAGLHTYIRPVAQDRREAMNRRIMRYVLPLCAAMFIIWSLGATYEGGVTYAVRIERILFKMLKNQDVISSKVDKSADDIVDIKSGRKQDSATSANYREKLDKRFDELEQKVTSQGLKIERVNVRQQQQEYKNRNK